MPEPESVMKAHARVRPVLKEVQRYVAATLEPFTKANSYLFLDRVKTSSALSEKLEGGRFGAWSELDDLYACTIVVPTAMHEQKVLEKLNSSFSMKVTRSRSSSKKPPDVFRFDGIRWYGRMTELAASERQPGIGEVLFEVQVITAFEWAWLSVTHDLVYKGDSADWSHQRLAALLKAAVEQIEVLIAAFSPASEVILESPWLETEATVQVVNRCKALANDGLIPETLIPESWRRFSDNFVALVRSYERDREKVAESTEKLLDVIESELRRPKPTTLPVSGTLFQYVISVVGRIDTVGNLKKFNVVPSSELHEIYGCRDIPKQFIFDGIALPQSEESADLGGAAAPAVDVEELAAEGDGPTGTVSEAADSAEDPPADSPAE